MLITLLQENLLKNTALAIRFIATKPQIPVLAGLALRVKDGKLTLQSTDTRVGYESSLMVKADEDGETVVPAKVFYDFLHSLFPGVMTLKLEKETLLMTQKNVKAKIPTFPIAQFPPFPELNTTQIALNREKFISAISNVIYATSLDETRPVLASLLFDLKVDSLTCVCTDGYRLSMMTTELMVKADEPQSLLLPARALQEIVSVARNSNTENILIGVSKALSTMSMTIDENVILVRMVEGQFPPYEKIIPTEFVFETLLDREELVSALKTAMVFARESSSIVTLVFDGKTCAVSAAGASVGENENVLDTSFEALEPLKIAFNGKYLLDVLNHVETDRIVFKIVDELKPGLILPEGQEYPLSVVMPFKR